MPISFAAFPLFSFEFTCSCDVYGIFFPPTPGLSFGARRAREEAGCKSLQAIFCPDWSFLAVLWFIPLPLLFQDCAYMPARASQRAVHQGWAGPNRHNHGAGSQAVSLGAVTWRVEKSKKVRGVHFATPA